MRTFDSVKDVISVYLLSVTWFEQKHKFYSKSFVVVLYMKNYALCILLYIKHDDWLALYCS